MIIPQRHTFKCFADGTLLLIDVGNEHSFDVLFAMGDDEEGVLIKDPEQVLMIRDMLTVWLSRQKQPEVGSVHCTAHVDYAPSSAINIQRCSECGDCDCNGQCIEIP